MSWRTLWAFYAHKGRSRILYISYEMSRTIFSCCRDVGAFFFVFFLMGGLGAFFFLWGGYNFLDFIIFKTFCVSLKKWGEGGGAVAP